MELQILHRIFEDGLFAAIAAIGFSSISNTPRRAYAACALIAAVGHAIRFVMMSLLGVNIIVGSAVAAVFIGTFSVFTAPHIKCPAEVCFFPALLPMIPGMYAYRTVEAMAACLCHDDEAVFSHYLYLMTFNGLTCVFIISGMVIGATIPVFIFRRQSQKKSLQAAHLRNLN